MRNMWQWAGVSRSRRTWEKSFSTATSGGVEARKIPRDSHFSRHGRDNDGVEQANIYFDQAMKTRPEAAWEALLKKILKGDSKRIWHGKPWEQLTPEQRKLTFPMMKNYIEKYYPSGEFETSKVRVLVRGDLQQLIGETQGPVTRTESIYILISIAIYHALELFKIDITAAYLNTPMNDDVKHKWLMLDKDEASVLNSMDPDYWKTYLRRDGKNLVELDKIMYGFKEAAHYWNKT